MFSILYGTMTFSIMILSITTFSIMILSITTFSIITYSITTVGIKIASFWLYPGRLLLTPNRASLEHASLLCYNVNCAYIRLYNFRHDIIIRQNAIFTNVMLWLKLALGMLVRFCSFFS
jgi:hypothetical protein